MAFDDMTCSICGVTWRQHNTGTAKPDHPWTRLNAYPSQPVTPEAEAAHREPEPTPAETDIRFHHRVMHISGPHGKRSWCDEDGVPHPCDTQVILGILDAEREAAHRDSPPKSRIDVFATQLQETGRATVHPGDEATALAALRAIGVETFTVLAAPIASRDGEVAAALDDLERAIDASQWVTAGNRLVALRARLAAPSAPSDLTAEQCGAMRLCEQPKGHSGRHSTSVDRAIAAAPSAPPDYSIEDAAMAACAHDEVLSVSCVMCGAVVADGKVVGASQSGTVFTFPDGTIGPGNWNLKTGEVVPAAPSAPPSGDLPDVETLARALHDQQTFDAECYAAEFGAPDCPCRANIARLASQSDCGESGE